MKRIVILVSVVILLFFSGCRLAEPEDTVKEAVSDNKGTIETSSLDEDIHKEPPESIDVRSLSELEKMRWMITQPDDRYFEQYLRSVAGGGAHGREDLIAFVDLVETLPVLSLIDGDITWISYKPDTQNGTEFAFVAIKAPNGEWTRLEYRLFVEDIPAEIRALKAAGEISATPEIDYWQTADGRIKVYSENKKAHPTEKGDLYTWLMSIDGILTNVVYYTESAEPVDVTDILVSASITHIE